jgi:RNA polymerase sigma-70 factor (ECF subfamily)
VGTTPAESVEGSGGKGIRELSITLDGSLLEELWQECGAESCGIEKAEFNRIIASEGLSQNFGQAAGETASHQAQAAFYRGLKLGDLVLARACAAGNERAWERFVAMYRQPLVRAAIAITRSETLGQELADQLYAELFGLTTRDGERRCPLASYRGRGSLVGWLRTTLAQRHVDHHRRSHREQPLEEYDAPAEKGEEQPAPGQLSMLEKAVERAFDSCEAEDRLLLSAYYLDGRTLLEIARVLHVHEATVSRKLKRVYDELRKEILRNLQRSGMSRRAAEETLGTNPKDLDLNLKLLLQCSQADAFEEKKAE